MIPTYLLPSVARAECAGLVIKYFLLPSDIFIRRCVVTSLASLNYSGVWEGGAGGGAGAGRTTASIYRDRVRRRVIP